MTSNCSFLTYFTSETEKLQVECPTALVQPTYNVLLFGGDTGYYFLFDVKKENMTWNVDFI